MFLQACLGLSVQAGSNRILFDRPLLPGFLNNVTIRQLALGESRVDLSLDKQAKGVTISVLAGEGAVDVIAKNK